MSIMTSIKRNMIGGKNETGTRAYQADRLANLFRQDEYEKHRTHRRDLGLEPVPRQRRRRALKKREV
jgi:hypothetical protein